MDLIICDSCNQLIQRSKIKFYFKDDDFITKNNIIHKLNIKDRSQFQFCNSFCLQYLADNEIPKYSHLNNMPLNELIEELKCINQYELILIQLAKCFQTIVNLHVLIKNNFTKCVLALKGKFFFCNTFII
jgi:hypothetical protein